MGLTNKRFILIIIFLTLFLNGCFNQSPGYQHPNDYTVSGFVGRDYDGQAIEGVTINFSNGAASVVTDKDGKWSKSGLTDQIEVTPVYEGWSFYPSSKTIVPGSSNVDFTGTNGPAGTFAISGQISSGGIPLEGIIIKFSNGDSTTTNSEGKWMKTGLSGEVTITPFKNGWGFIPSELKSSHPNCKAFFTGTFSVSGKVTNAYNGQSLAGIIIRATNHNPTITNTDGSWVLNGVELNTKISPEQAGWISTPTDFTVNQPTSNINFVNQWNDLSGKFVYSTSDQFQNTDIHAINPEDLTDTILTTDHLSRVKFSWIDKNKQILFSKKHPMNWHYYDFYFMNFDGSGVTRITNEDSDKFNPVYSHDKSKIVYCLNGSNIYVMNADGSNSIIIPPASSIWYKQFDPDWTWNANSIVYAAYGSDGTIGKNAIFISNSDGSIQQKITNDDTMEYFNPRWSPDGLKICFAGRKFNHGGNTDIYIMDYNGANCHSITNTDTPKYNPCWFSSELIAFIEDNSIYVISINGSHESGKWKLR